MSYKNIATEKDIKNPTKKYLNRKTHYNNQDIESIYKSVMILIQHFLYIAQDIDTIFKQKEV